MTKGKGKKGKPKKTTRWYLSLLQIPSHLVGLENQINHPRWTMRTHWGWLRFLCFLAVSYITTAHAFGWQLLIHRHMDHW